MKYLGLYPSGISKPGKSKTIQVIVPQFWLIKIPYLLKKKSLVKPTFWMVFGLPGKKVALRTNRWLKLMRFVKNGFPQELGEFDLAFPSNTRQAADG